MATANKAENEYDYLIIGAGIFGASTAHHLIEKYPDATICLVDRTPYPCPLAASWDWNKVVRADYGNAFYMQLALEAVDKWRNDPLYKEWYHQSGYVTIGNAELCHRMMKNYESLSIDIQPGFVGPAELNKRYKDFYKHTTFSGIKDDIFVNEASGWAQADKALKAVIDDSVAKGVQYLENELSRLLFDDFGRCIGFEGKNGRTYQSKKTVLATGAETARLLADSAPHRDELQAKHRLTAGAVIIGLTELTSQEAKKYSHIPVSIYTIDSIHGEILPLAPEDDHYNLKWCWDESFKNTVYHKASRQNISMPPQEEGQGQRTPSQGLKDKIEIIKKGFMGVNASQFPVTSYRVCWDAVTPNQDFIIAEHPLAKDLFLAVGGSFHGWKFLPTIGKYVVDLLDGTLEESLAKRWAWDRPNEGSAHMELPQKELIDV